MGMILWVPWCSWFATLLSTWKGLIGTTQTVFKGSLIHWVSSASAVYVFFFFLVKLFCTYHLRVVIFLLKIQMLCMPWGMRMWDIWVSVEVSLLSWLVSNNLLEVVNNTSTSMPHMSPTWLLLSNQGKRLTCCALSKIFHVHNPPVLHNLLSVFKSKILYKERCYSKHLWIFKLCNIPYNLLILDLPFCKLNIETNAYKKLRIIFWFWYFCLLQEGMTTIIDAKLVIDECSLKSSFSCK